MTAALLLSHHRLVGIIMRYGVPCHIQEPAAIEADKPWQLANEAFQAESKPAHILLSEVNAQSAHDSAPHKKQASAMVLLEADDVAVPIGALIKLGDAGWVIEQSINVTTAPKAAIYRFQLSSYETGQ